MASTESRESWTIRKVLTWTAQHFEKREIDAPRLTAEILLAHVLGESRVKLYVDLDRPLAKEELSSFRALIERRSQHEPTQYLTGHKDFYNRRFGVDPTVLIPRPETEELVDAVLRTLPRDVPATIADLCTGTGCIAVTLAAERPMLTVHATDLSPDACAMAKRNRDAHGMGARVEIFLGDLLGPLRGREPEGGYDAIVSNPPYIASGELAGLSAEVRREPQGALDGGADGLTLLRRIAEESLPFLKPGALLALEIGEAQGPAVRALLEAEGFIDVRIEQDLGKLDRFAFGRRPPESESNG